MRQAWTVIAALAGCAGAPRTFTPTDRAAVGRVLADQAAAWNRGDLEAYMAGYARIDALVFTSGGKVRTGWQATLDSYRARYGQDPSTMGKLGFEILRVDPVGPDAAIVLGRWRLTDSAHPGSGVFSVIFERRPSGWQIVHDHTSADAP